MKTLQIFLMVALPMFAAVASIAEDAAAATCGGDDCTGFIKSVSVFKGGHSLGGLVRLDTDSSPTGSGHCTVTNNGGSWEIMPADENTIRTLVSAHLAGRKVTLRQVGSGNCKVEYVTVW